MRTLGRDGDLAFCTRQAVCLGSCPAFFPIPAPTGSQGRHAGDPVAPRGPPDWAVLLLGWCGMGLAACGGDSESVPAGREA